MDTRTYKSLVKDIAAQYRISTYEIDAILAKCVARAYKGINSAVLWDNGSVTVAYINGDNVIYLKDYIVSKAKFKEILLLIQGELSKYIYECDIKHYMKSRLDSTIELKIVGEKLKADDKFINIEPINSIGYLKLFTFQLDEDSLFKNDLKNFRNNGDEPIIFESTIIRYNIKTKRVMCLRFTKGVALEIFKKTFEKMNMINRSDFQYKKLFVTLDKKSKSVKYKVVFSKKPNGGFISELNKMLNKKIGNVEIFF